MKWLIPAKTFLIGEYAAIAEASAIVLTTAPCFELTLAPRQELSTIHPQSPAGLWWSGQNHQNSLSWYDPYAGCGGLGASSAQFIAAYWASCYLQGKKPQREEMLSAYYQVAWNGIGLRPSGYDVIAQSMQGCVYINKQKQIIQTYAWPFKELSFFLIHTGIKLATHHHLQDTNLPGQIDYLSTLVDKTRDAFEHNNPHELLSNINEYHKKLCELNLVAEHSLRLIKAFKAYPEVEAIKGCGALGADILLLIASRKNASILNKKLNALNYNVLATEKSVFIP